MLWLLWLGCGGAEAPAASPAAVESAAPEALSTRAGRYRLRWTAEPAQVPFNTLFSVRTVLTDAAGAPITDGSVVVDAGMPQHGHGMPTRPIAEPGTCTGPDACSHPGGVYLSTGLKFHMQGEWVIHFDVTGPAGSDTLDVHYTL